jgi:hypothetical protein
MADIKLKYEFNRAETGYIADTLDVSAGAATTWVDQVATVTLTADEIKELNTTPIALVAAPGAGKVIVVDRIFGESIGVTAPFDAGTSTLRFQYSGGAQVTADLPVTFIEAAAGSTVYGTVGGIEAALVPVANTAIVATITSADPAADTAAGTITLTVVYRVFS